MYYHPETHDEQVFRLEEKPVDLYKYAILADSDPGQLVVDLFCGSGTILEAGLLTGRRVWASDADPAAQEVCQGRAQAVDALIKNSKTPMTLVFDAQARAPRRPPVLLLDFICTRVV
jgi:adenine-specific DNA-methyltransferase